MKFGKRLQSQIEEMMLDWRPNFIAYEELKKSLKTLQGPVCFSEATFKQEISPSLEVVNENASSVVEIGDPSLVQESSLYKPVKNNGQFFDNGLVVEPMTSSDDVPLEPAASNMEQFLENGILGMNGVIGKKKHEPVKKGHKRAKLGDGTTQVSIVETDFMTLLNKELNKLNVFFVEKEEEYVIRFQKLKYRIERLKKEQASDGGCFRRSSGYEEVLNILRDIVAFHGEMVLLENYSSLNYTGLVKIMKKHDKVTGTVLRLPYIQSVLLQPFFTTELLSKLVRECENNLHSLFPISPSESICSQLKQERGSLAFTTDSNNSQTLPFILGETVEIIYRSTVVALKTMKEIRLSSTPSIFSLPPTEGN